MSRELVERFLAAIDAWNREDLETWLDLAADEWRTAGIFPGVEPVYRGREGMLALWQYLREPWESPPERRVASSLQIELQRVEDLGNTVLALTSLRTRSEGGRAEITVTEVAYVLTDEKGFLRLKNYFSWDEALEATGLRD